MPLPLPCLRQTGRLVWTFRFGVPDCVRFHFRRILFLPLPLCSSIPAMYLVQLARASRHVEEELQPRCVFDVRMYRGSRGGDLRLAA